MAAEAAAGFESIPGYGNADTLLQNSKGMAQLLRRELQEAQARAATEAAWINQQNQWRGRGLCQYCGGSFKGLFAKKCANCGRPKDYLAKEE